jgi:hypothetical protein
MNSENMLVEVVVGRCGSPNEALGWTEKKTKTTSQGI